MTLIRLMYQQGFAHSTSKDFSVCHEKKDKEDCRISELCIHEKWAYKYILQASGKYIQVYQLEFI